MATLSDCIPVDSLEVTDPTVGLPTPVVDPVQIVEGPIEAPGIGLSWDEIETSYVVGVEIQYEPIDGSTSVKTVSAAKDTLGWNTTDAIVPGKVYRVRARYIGAASNTYGPWSEWENVTAPPNLTSTDTTHVGGVETSVLIAGIANTAALAAANSAAIEALEIIYGDTASAAASAAAAAASSAAAIQAKADAIIAQGAAQSAASAASADALAAAGSASSALTSKNDAAASASTATTKASDAAGSAATATTQAGLAAGSATTAGGAATAAAGSASTASTQATNAGNSASAATAAKVAAESARDAAGSSATAAATSASAAATSATAAGTSATASNADRLLAETARGQAQTSATNAANSASGAAGSASTATAQAALSATARDAAQGFATAANTSASNASGFATAAGNSAAASSASAVSAAASFSAANLSAAMLMPDRYDGTTGSYFTASVIGEPASRGDLPPNAVEPGYGPVRDLFGITGSDDFATRGVVPAVAGRIYKVEAEFQRVAKTGTPNTSSALIIYLRCLTDTYANVSAVGSAFSLNDTVQTASVLFSDVASPGVQAWPAGSVWLRPNLRQAYGSLTAQTTRVRRLTIEDVTESRAALAQATASANSASSAAASSTAAGQSAVAANSAKVAAETARGQAQTSATNAASSETNAAGSASAASTSATNSANSAGLSAGSATAAAGSASTATTKATEAGNSAASAAASQVSAASSYAAANLSAAMLMPDRYDGTSGSYFTSSAIGEPASRGDLPSNAVEAGYGPVRDITGAAGFEDFATRGVVAPAPGRIYKVEAEFQRIAKTGTPNNSSALVIYLRGLNADYSSRGNPGISTVLDDTVQTTSVLFSDVASPGVNAWSAGAAWLRPVLRQGYGSLTAQTVRIRRLTIEDVTESRAALAQANAAATSASNAATSSTAAGSSATAAAGSATTATTQAGNASTYAGQASTSATNAANSATAAAISSGTAATARDQANTAKAGAEAAAATSTTQASNASASAAAAATSATVAASVGTRSYFKNVNFNDFPTTPGIPANWINSVSGTGTRVAGETATYGYQLAGPAGAQGNIAQDGISGAISTGQYVVVEAHARLDAGTLIGSGVTFMAQSGAATVQTFEIPFSTTPDSTGVAPGNGVLGRVYRLSKLVQITAAGANIPRLYVSSHRNGLGSTAAANLLTWFFASARPATPEEIAAGVGLPLTEAKASLALSAAVDAQTKLGEAQFSATAQAGGDPGQVFVRAGPLGSVAGFIASTIKLATVVGGTVINVFEIIGTSAHFAGKVFIGAAKQITLDPTIPAISVNIGGSTAIVGQLPNDDLIAWFGPTVAVASMTKANATAWADTVANAYFGGSLSAGILTNKISASSMAVGDQTETAEFGSNGGTITVAASGSFSSNGSRRSPSNPGSASGSNGPTVLQLWRRIGTAAYAQVATINVTGAWTRTVTDFNDDNPQGRYQIVVVSSAGGSITYTDPSLSVDLRQYKLVVQSRTSMTEAGQPGAFTSNQMTIIATE